MGNDIDTIFDHILAGKSLFTDRDVLRNEYIPDHILFRDDQISQLAQILAPVLRRSKPSNVFLYGKTGTGKTVVARYVLKKLAERTAQHELNIEFVYTNTRIASTPYHVLFEVGSQLGAQIPFTGLSMSGAMRRIFERIGASGTNIVLVLDEVDYLVKNFDDDLLYDLTRPNADIVGSSFISLVGISNDLKFKEYLDPRVLSSLGEEELVFPPYMVGELEAILSDRVRLAFRPNVVADTAVKLCASLAAMEHGDARRAVDLLRVAGELAEREGSDQVTTDHVMKAARSIERDRVYEAARSLPLHAKLVLAVVTSSNNELNTGQVYSRYAEICKTSGLTPLTQRRVSSIISELDVLGLVNAPVISSGRFGRSKKIKLVASKDSVIKALREDDVLISLLS